MSLNGGLQCRIISKFDMVVEVLIAQGDGINPLDKQGFDTVLYIAEVAAKVYRALGMAVDTAPYRLS